MSVNEIQHDFGKQKLVDGGDRSPGVVAYLNDYVDGSIEALVATHPPADHIGGISNHACFGLCFRISSEKEIRITITEQQYYGVVVRATKQ